MRREETQQILLAFEVVVNQPGCNPGIARHIAIGGPGKALLRENVHGRVDNLLAPFLSNLQGT